MKKRSAIFLFLLFFLSNRICFGITQEDKLNTLLHSLDPKSISEHFSFYHLYPKTEQGKKALETGWKLLNVSNPSIISKLKAPFSLPNFEMDTLVNLVNLGAFNRSPSFSDKTLAMIESCAAYLSNKKLKGHFVENIDQLKSLKVEEVDLSRALLLYECDSLQRVREIEATIDLMALQILARLPANPTDLQKIKEISRFIFFENGFRFPPNSLMAEAIDEYTFLPSVLDKRKGVCLGISILYLSLAQRLNLPLEIVTPPGHIYVRYPLKGVFEGDDYLNIETTARGIHVPSKHYLSIHTYQLKTRNIKEVIGLSFINQASILWQKEKVKDAIFIL